MFIAWSGLSQTAYGWFRTACDWPQMACAWEPAWKSQRIAVRNFREEFVVIYLIDYLSAYADVNVLQ